VLIYYLLSAHLVTKFEYNKKIQTTSLCDDDKQNLLMKLHKLILLIRWGEKSWKKEMSTFMKGFNVLYYCLLIRCKNINIAPNFQSYTYIPDYYLVILSIRRPKFCNVICLSDDANI
jgi:hypothetical protein